MNKTAITFIFIISMVCSGLGQTSNNEIIKFKKEFSLAKTDTAKAIIAYKLSEIYINSNSDSAIYYSRQLVKIASLSKNKDFEFRSRMHLARVLSERDIPESMKENFIALQLAEKINNKKYIASCYRAIGLLHLYLGNNNKYIDYLQKAIVIQKKGNNTKSLMSSYAEIGGIHPNSDSARYYLKLAAKDTMNLNSAYYNYYCGNNETNPQKALAFFLKSITIAEKERDFRGLSLASRWLSIFYQKNGDLNSGILAAKKGLNAARQINMNRGIMNNSEQLSIIYKNLKQIDSAYKYQTIMIAAKDSLIGIDKINRIQNTIIEEQQRAQNLQTEKNELEVKIKLFVSIGISFVFLLLALLFFINQRKTKKSNFILQSQQEEIESKNGALQQSLDNLKATQSQLIQSEKMASLGELTAGIAHEIQNPLNFVNNFSEVSSELLEEMNEELNKGDIEEAKAISSDIKENLEKINHHGKRADAIVKGMLQHSRSSSGTKEPTDINKLADEYLRLAYHGLRAKDKSFNATLVTNYDETIGKIDIIPQEMGRVILNLITNAFYATGEKKHLDIDGFEPTVTVSTKKTGNTIEITIADNANGIPSKVLDKIFQPFFTTKPTGQGTGLGLSLAYDIVKAHGGELKVNTRENVGLPAEQAGTEFIIELPLN